MFQRGKERVGSRLGKSTGWIHRAKLRRRNVEAVAGCEYVRIDDQGLHYRVDGIEKVHQADTVVLCAGQEMLNELVEPLKALGVDAEVIGGAKYAGELDALRAIDEGTRLAYRL
jgi:2,4-dienoyl-CoA reductase (NADPH2)